MDLKESDILGPKIDDHWYYTAKARAMLRFLGNTRVTSLLDVGAGSAYFSRYLLKNRDVSEAWCVDTSYAEDSDTSENGKPLHLRRSVEHVDADLVLLMDVLEHVDDDAGLLREYIDKVPENTHFLITVPAFSFMWSAHDEFLEHRRRYSLKQLESVVAEAGLSVSKGSYYFGAVFPIAAATRLLQRSLRKGSKPESQLRLHHPLVNATLKLLCSLELPLMPINRLAGLSVFCLAKKQ